VFGKRTLSEVEHWTACVRSRLVVDIYAVYCSKLAVVSVSLDRCRVLLLQV
jgi:hypothetical protein